MRKQLIRFLLAAMLCAPAIRTMAENQVLGELEFQGVSNVERDSGVWVDGQYVGYLKELHGSKKVLLLPGTHDIAVRQDGYVDFRTSVSLQPGEKQVVLVKMEKDLRFQMPRVFSEIKITVSPDRAAVFVDDQLVGHAGEFSGLGRSLLVAPGHRRIVVSLPGYQTFQTEVDLAPKQKFELKTKLQKLDSKLPSTPE